MLYKASKTEGLSAKKIQDYVDSSDERHKKDIEEMKQFEEHRNNEFKQLSKRVRASKEDKDE